MVEIRPFRGILYDTARIGPDISEVVCPPYDVISPDQGREYHLRHPYNAIRLILGEDRPGDTPDGDNRYRRAAAYFESWRADGILTQDASPALYLLEESYADEDGRPRTRLGVICLVRLSDIGSSTIRPHEATHEGPKQDRFELIKATSANFCQVFTLYTDPTHTLERIAEDICRGRPRLEAGDEEGVKRRLYAIVDPEHHKSIQQTLEQKELLIADGHHRYETALAYRDWRRSREGFDGRAHGYDYLMMYLTNTQAEGLTIYPTHRILTKYAQWDPQRFLQQIQDLFSVETIPGTGSPEDARLLREAMASRAGDGRVRIGMKSKALKDYHLLTLEDEARADRLLGEAVHPELRRLDVKILHAILLERCLGISQQDQDKGTNIVYVHGAERAVRMMEEDLLHCAVFFLNPPSVTTVSRVARAGEKMPQKSTFFYPKLLTGLVFRTIEDLDEEE
jgi:uncharacterized protein (DUF1015 family)